MAGLNILKILNLLLSTTADKMALQIIIISRSILMKKEFLITKNELTRKEIGKKQVQVGRYMKESEFEKNTVI